MTELIDLEYLQWENKKLLSWSRNGLIAYSIPNNKENLLLTYLENVNGKTWKLSTPQKIIVKPNEGQIPELSLLEWSYLNTDLAISDVYGNFYILLSGVGLIDEKEGMNSNGSVNSINSPSPSYELTSYNHLEVIFKDIIVPNINSKPNHSLKVVAFKWLPIEKSQLIGKEAKLVHLPNAEDKKFAYSYGLSQHQPNNLCHPISTKQACIGLRANGEIVIFYQGEHKVEYHKLSGKLNEGINKNLNITQAEFGFPNEKHIILIAYDEFSNKIITYKIFIDWGFLTEAAAKQKMDPHYNTPKESQTSPKLRIETVYQMAPLSQHEFNGVIYEDDENDPQPVKKEDDMDIDNFTSTADGIYKPKLRIGKLASFHIVSPHLDDEDSMDIFVNYYNYDENFKISTSMYRYRLAESNNPIINAFSEIGMTKDEESTKEYYLQLYDQTNVPSQIIGILGTTCAMVIVCGDGTSRTFARKNNTIIHVNESNRCEKMPEKISSLAEIGFVLPTLEMKSPIAFGFSPFYNLAYFELNQTDLDIKIVFLEKLQCLELSPEELYKTSVGFALYHSQSCYFNLNSDDLLIIIQLEIDRVSKKIGDFLDMEKIPDALDSFIESIICESHKAINFQLDVFNKETVDKLLSNPPLQKLLSLQLILGGLEGRINNISQNIAWIVLNLRSCSFGIMFLLSSIYRQLSKKKPTEDTYQDSVTRAESIISLTGNVRWLVELIIYLNQELLELYMSNKHKRPSKISFENSIVLPILISKVPRLFLMYALSSISKTQEVLKRLHKDLEESNKLFTPMKDALNRYFTSCSNSPLNLPLFETFIKECDGYILKEMNDITTKTSKTQALKLEQQMFCHGKIGPGLFQVGRWIIEKYSSFIVRDLKVAEMFYYDVNWINISNDFKDELELVRDEPIFTSKNCKTVPRQRINDGYIDALRKIIICSNSQGLRKCTRCRSVSLVNDPLIFGEGNIGLWTMVFQRTCVCGSSWANV